MRARALALRLHLVVGVLTGAALLVLGLSGAALVFRPEIDEALYAAHAARATGAPPASLDVLVDAARRRHPGFPVAGLSLPGHRDAAARVRMVDPAGAELDVLVDPRTGESLGSLWLERSPLHALRLLHSELYMGARGAAIVGLFGLWLFVQGVTGLYLWWPLMKRPRWGLTIRWSRPWPVPGYDLHKALGAASLLFHLPIAATGALLGLAALAPGMAPDAPAWSRPPGRTPLPLDTLGREAERALPGGRIAAFHFSPAGSTVAVTMRMPGELDPRGASLVVLAATLGQVLSVHDARQGRWTARLLGAVRAVHVGDVGGAAARAMYVLGGLASAALALSGYVLALARSR